MNTKFKILYAEDKADIRKNFSYFLQSKYPNALIYEVDNGTDALRLYHEYHPDILLTDINMPGLDGLKLIDEVRKHSKHIKIIFLTAYSDQEKLLHAISHNVVDYLVKPINRTKLCEAIDTALETLPIKNTIASKYIHFSDELKWNIQTKELTFQNRIVVLSKYESRLLDLFIQNKNVQLESIDIFFYVWQDSDKEFNPTSVRSLVKNLRKKLPKGVIDNIYGGLYILRDH